MRPGIVLRVVLVGALATVSMGLACGEGPLDSVAPSVTSKSLPGAWAGPIVNLTMRVTLTESSGLVTGSGTMVTSSETFTLSVTGTSNNGSFELTVAEAAHDPFTFTGSVVTTGTQPTLTGVGNGSGLSNTAITLTKQ
jgi:hypothetical protein